MDAKSLTTGVYERIRSDILTCRLLPGRKLKINDLCIQHGVSLGAVREALSRLTAEGLVVAEAQRGFQVAPVSSEDLADLTRARIEIEALCLRRAIELGDVAWEARVLGADHVLARLPEHDPDDPDRMNEAWSKAHADFHAILADACASPWLLRLRGMLYEQSERYRRLSVPAGRAERDIPGEHRAIVSAVLARDADAAVAALTDHLSATTRILLSTAPV